MNKFHLRRTAALAVFLVFGALRPTEAQNTMRNSPSSLAKLSFERMKNGEFKEFASLFAPSELDRFKKFAAEVLELPVTNQTKTLKKLLNPIEASSISQTPSSTVLATFVENSVNAAGAKELLAESDLTILGVVEESGELAHVISYSTWPRPSPITCQKNDDVWQLSLTEEANRIMESVRRNQHFKIEDEVALSKLIAGVKIGELEIVGHVMQSAERAQVLCRLKMAIQTYKFSMLACYPVNDNEEGWQHLNKSKYKSLADALQQKWQRQPPAQ